MQHLYRKTVLKAKSRIAFDPTNAQHLKDYASFLKYNNWVNGCSYFLEDPYEDIPSMIKQKLIKHFMAKYMETV